MTLTLPTRPDKGAIRSWRAIRRINELIVGNNRRRLICQRFTWDIYRIIARPGFCGIVRRRGLYLPGCYNGDRG